MSTKQHNGVSYRRLNTDNGNMLIVRLAGITIQKRIVPPLHQLPIRLFDLRYATTVKVYQTPTGELDFVTNKDTQVIIPLYVTLLHTLVYKLGEWTKELNNE